MKQRRWLKSIIATSQEQMPALPFQRGNRRKPISLKSAPPAPSAERATVATQ
ncbi:hypothetical protein ACEN2J_09570 [Pseudorhodobacter sp. W20_MBD10_FR17]|uniref:hypothetical protein n=1 Tax=Pseudorhodobacter sp. W20_MBD10_FR17 TaxID=3240266 RepID=UPI003F96FDD6